MSAAADNPVGTAVNDDGLIHAVQEAAEQRQLRAWAGLAIAALAFAGSPALLLAASRVPGIEELSFWPLDYFQRALVVHVVLSIVVWTLATFGALAQVAALSLPSRGMRLRALGPVSVWMGWLSLPLLMIPGFSNLGEPSLNNYVPVILHPIYGLGLAMIFGGVALSVLRLLANIAAPADRTDPTALALGIMGIIFFIALACFALAAITIGSRPWSTSHMEHLFWGGGHILQFVNLGLLLVGLSLLFTGWAEGTVMSPAKLTIVFILILIPAASGPLWYMVEDHFYWFSKLKFVAGIPALAFLIFALPALKQAWSERSKSNPTFLASILAMAVFALGGVLGFFVDGTDTRTPSHYHGVLGAVNIALMGLFYALIMPMLSRPVGHLKRIPWQLWLYASGQAFQCLGLFLAGGYGAPRKTAGAEQDLEHIGAIAGMYMNGIGALIAVIGGILFIWTVGYALMKKSGQAT